MKRQSKNEVYGWVISVLSSLITSLLFVCSVILVMAMLEQGIRAVCRLNFVTACIDAFIGMVSFVVMYTIAGHFTEVSKLYSEMIIDYAEVISMRKRSEEKETKPMA